MRLQGTKCLPQDLLSKVDHLQKNNDSISKAREMPISKKLSAKVVRQGKSIEEIMVMRKLEGGDPNSWPSVDSKKSRIGPQSISAGKMFSSSTPSMLRENISAHRNSASTLSRPTKVLTWDEENETKDQTIKALTEYCTSLQTRLKEMESTLRLREFKVHEEMRSPSAGTRVTFSPVRVRDRNQSANSAESFPASGSRGSDTYSRQDRRRFTADGSDSDNQKVPITAYFESNAASGGEFGSTNASSQLERTVDDLNEKITHLRYLFNTRDPLEQRHAAVTLITKRVRGMLARVRYRHFLTSLKDWKWSRCGSLVRLVGIGLQTATAYETSVRQMSMSRDMRCKLLIFTKWEHIVRQTAPMRKAVREAAELKGYTKDRELVRKVFYALYDACIGRSSNKYARKERRMMIDQVRKELSEQQQQQGITGVVTEKVLTRELHRVILQKYLEKRSMQIRLDAFLTIKSLFDRSRVFAKKALKARFTTLAGKCFYSWSDWVYMVGMGLDRRRWTGPRKYEVRYNQKIIDTYSKNRLQRMAFRPWKRFAARRSEADRRFRNRITLFLGSHFMAWHRKASHLRRLRVESVDGWKGYATLMMKGPFQSWVQYAESAQTIRIQQDRLVKTYIRWKRRQRLSLILRTWRHQAVYGRVEGMYTRNMLSRSLGEQKLLSTSLQRMLTNQTIELEECRDLVNKEIEMRKAIEVKLLAKDQEILRHEMINDHRNQELRRLEAIIEAMAIINPRQIKHLKDLQLDFKFKKRVFDLLPTQSENDIGDDMDDSDLDDLEDEENGVEKLLDFTSELNDGNGNPNPAAVISQLQSEHGGMFRSHGAGDRKRSMSERRFSEANPPAFVPLHPLQNYAFQALSEADRGLLLRARWLVSLYGGAEKPAATAILPPVEVNKTYGGGPKPVVVVDTAAVPTNDAAQPATPLSAADVNRVGGMLLSLLAFLEKGDTHIMSPADLKSWTATIMSSIRSQDATGGGGLQSETQREGKSPSPVDQDGSWRDILLNLRTMYPIAGADLHDRLEVGLSLRITDMRRNLANVMRAKSAKQNKRAEEVEGLMLLPTTPNGDDNDLEPNIFAANTANLVRDAKRRNASLHTGDNDDETGGINSDKAGMTAGWETAGTRNR
eukprot:gene331-592_t